VKRFTLIAVDPEGKRREWPLDQEVYTVGREPDEEAENPVAVPGDRHLSRHHFCLKIESEKVVVERSPRGRNPLFFNGEQTDLFSLRPGQVFYTGKTQFGVVLRQEATATTHYTLARKAKEEARLRRLEDCFSAVFRLLSALREQTDSPAWLVAFPVLRDILPEVRQVAFLQLHSDSEVWRVIDQVPNEEDFQLPAEIVAEAIKTRKTVTWVWEDVDIHLESEQTLCPSYSWTIATPVNGLERAQYLLCVSGVGALEREALEERATLVDLIGELVGHHIVIRQGSEYSSLLGVFGHHVGTLFKTSGALQLWSDPKTDGEVKRVLDHLLPIWGISQAISLHKKRGEKAHKALLESWVAKPEVDPQELQDALESMVGYVYRSHSGEPFMSWCLNGESVPKSCALRTLPPLDDVPQLFDKTLALTIGLLEMLNNVRKYPSARGSGREDRRDLKDLSEEERVVQVHCSVNPREASIEVLQPTVTSSDGSIPRSRSLQRIRALENSLLGALVGTEPEVVLRETSVPHVVVVKHRWTYRYRQLMEDWRKHIGS
jgi:hypothetical protein